MKYNKAYVKRELCKWIDNNIDDGDELHVELYLTRGEDSMSMENWYDIEEGDLFYRTMKRFFK